MSRPMTTTTTTHNKSEGMSAGFMLFLVFLVLKLTHVINWSWWWVTAPLWGGFAIFIGFCMIVLIGFIIASIVGK